MAEPVSQPTEKPLTPRQAERRRRILNAAQALVARDGYDAVTMREIALAAGAAEKTLYNIFGTKDRLVALAAHDRSEGVFQRAAAAEPMSGWQKLRRFCTEATQATLDEPLLSRAMAVLLLDHAELVGLHALYVDHVGASLRDMVGEGYLVAQAPVDALVRAIRLGIVSSVLFWSKGEVADAEFESWLVRQCAQPLLPWATPAGTRQLLAEFHAGPAA
ncbi:MAG: TetR/AcrR family transcriptional regulator [Proteobacteria bacterium]|nr:TetR/AcrR family transcriptional regulator [Pseudomonadota bacterium]